MTKRNLVGASQEAPCLAVDDGEGRCAMLALFSGGKVDALLAMNPEAARSLAEDLLGVADEAESGDVLVKLPATRMGST